MGEGCEGYEWIGDRECAWSAGCILAGFGGSAGALRGSEGGLCPD